MANPSAFEIPYRPAYELTSAVAWLGTALSTLYVINATSFPSFPFRAALTVAAGMTVLRLSQGLPRYFDNRKLGDHRLAFLPYEKLQQFVAKQMKGKDQVAVWIGWGCAWTKDSSDRVYEVIRRGPEKLVSPKALEGGAYWLHAVAGKEEPVQVPIEYLQGHTIVYGTTGSGKTRLMEVLAVQAILRGDAVIVIDPKGDPDLRKKLSMACERLGDPSKFVLFDPAHPDNSYCVDPLHNWSQVTEIPSRVAELIPSEAGADPFKAFGWNALNNVVQGLVKVGLRPNLVNVRRYIESGVTPLLAEALTLHFDKVRPGWEEEAAAYQKGPRNQVEGHIRYYRDVVQPKHADLAIDGLIGSHEHNREHMQKLIASLHPLLSMLTSGPLSYLLSPSEEDAHHRNVTDISTIIKRGQVAYFALNTLADGMVGGAIGSMLLSDLTAVAGDRYNYGTGDRFVSVFVDEAAEVINDPFIQLLNKGRGANIRLTVCTQTIPDFIVRTGTQAAAEKTIGNLNNTICLRVIDKATIEYISQSLPEMPVRQIQTQYRSGSNSSGPTDFAGMYSESVKEEMMEMVPPAMLSKLPNFHYLARYQDGRIVKGRVPILTYDEKA